jgi:hypothetical protein
MTIDTAPLADVHETDEQADDPTGALADRLFASLLGTLDIVTIHIGDQLGL